MIAPAEIDDPEDETPVKLHRPIMEAGTCLICGGDLHAAQHHGTWYRCLHQFEGSATPCEHGCNS